MRLNILFSKQNADKIQTKPCAFRSKHSLATDISKFELKYTELRSKKKQFFTYIANFMLQFMPRFN